MYREGWEGGIGSTCYLFVRTHMVNTENVIGQVGGGGDKPSRTGSLIILIVAGMDG